jgi:hypothetical protein
MILLKQRVRLSLKPRQRTPRLRLRRRLWIRKQNPRFHHDHEPRATTRLVGEIQENKVALETPNTPPRAGSLLPWSLVHREGFHGRAAKNRWVWVF